MIGYNVIQPNGRVARLSGETPAERQNLVRSITDAWKDYCDSNWLSANTDDLFCPENKVKIFLNGLGYFLILGDTEGIETDYKKVMRGSREIPMSSCPSYIEDAVYCSGSTIKVSEDANGFESVLETVDAKAAKVSGYYKTPPRKSQRAKHERTRSDKFLAAMRDLGVHRNAFTHATVDTSGAFTYRGRDYRVSAPQYLPQQTTDGDDFYAMDRIVCVDGEHFYDMSMNEVSDFVEKLFETTSDFGE